MTASGNDLEQWQIADENPDESWESYAKSTSRTPKKLIIILLVTLSLGGIVFVVGRFLAGASAEETAPTTTATQTTVPETQDVNTLLSDMALRLNEPATEPFLAVQIFSSDIGVLGRVGTTQERDQIVTLLEETFTAELESDAITVDPEVDAVGWLDQAQNAIDVFSNEPILSNGFGINNSQIILDADLPQTLSQTNLIEAFGAIDLDLVDDTTVSSRDQTAELRVSLIEGAVEVNGTVPSQGVAEQVESSAVGVYGEGAQTDLNVSCLLYTSPSPRDQ